MRVKGKNQHVVPNDHGWRVIDEANKQVIQHFSAQEDAIRFAHECATTCEGEVLIHTSPSENLDSLSSVSLPQRECIPGPCHIKMNPSTPAAP